MEFFCVLSVGGSLASYHVRKESQDTYRAILKPTGTVRSDVPSEITLHKKAAGWEAYPPHNEIVQSLVNAIETKIGEQG